jgi:haloalkane dehalogenase
MTRPALAGASDVPAWVPRDLFPFPSRFLEVEGHAVHHVDVGSGPPLLLLHGNPTWSFLYRRVIERLSRRFRCIAPDYPGFGLSRAAPGHDHRPESHARVLERFVEQLGLEGLILVAQDWGGPIGLWVAGRQPERFRAFVLANTWAWPVNGDLHFEAFSRFWGGPLGRFAGRHFNAFVNVLLPLGVRRGRLPQRVMAAYRAPFRAPDAREPTWVFPREILASSRFLREVEQGLEGLREAPALILWGDRDVAFRAKERVRFESIFRCHRTRLLAGAGHFVQEDAPDEIAEAIEAWWPEAETGRAT